MIANGAISGGMIAKIESCLSVIEEGVEGIVILDGRVSAPHHPSRTVHPASASAP